MQRSYIIQKVLMQISKYANEGVADNNKAAYLASEHH